MSNKIGYRLMVSVIPYLVYWILRACFFTCRTTYHNREASRELLDRKISLVGVFWHYSLVYALYNERKNKYTAMVSASKDGEYIARVIKCFGMDVVRGSSNRHGLKALKQLIRIVADGNRAAIVADGSQGPPLKVQAGTILLASKTGSPIVPVVWSANRYFSFGSWDRLSIPKPFARIDYFYGDPVYVPPSLSSESLEKYRSDLELVMNEMYREAWSLQGKTEH